MKSPVLMRGMTAAAMLFGISGVASAENFYLCPPNTLATGCTTVFEEMTFNLFDVQSNYTDGPTLDAVAIPQATADTGISPGDTVSDTGTGNVTSFAPLLGTSDTQFLNANIAAGGYRLNLNIADLQQVVVLVDDTGQAMVDGVGQIGETVGVAAQIVSGLIDILYQDTANDPAPGDGTLVAQLQLIPGSGNATLANQIFEANVIFGGVLAADVALAQSLFFFEDNSSWYDRWVAGGDTKITARVDANNDSIPVEAGNAGFDYLRQNDVDGSIAFRVPEPATVALLGASLLGMGAATRRRRKNLA